MAFTAVGSRKKLSKYWEKKEEKQEKEFGEGGKEEEVVHGRDMFGERGRDILEKSFEEMKFIVSFSAISGGRRKKNIG